MRKPILSNGSQLSLFELIYLVGMVYKGWMTLSSLMCIRVFW